MLFIHIHQVHIIGHIQPPAYMKTYSWNYAKIVNR